MYADEIEPLLEEFAIRKAGRSTKNAAASRVSRCEVALDQARIDLERYRDDPRLHETLGDRSFRIGLSKRQDALERRALDLATARRNAQAPRVFSTRELEANWMQMTIDDRRALLEQHIDCVYVEPGDSAAHERAHVCTPGEAPTDVPPRGRPMGRLRPFRTTATRSVYLGPPKRWSVKRLEQELGEFLSGKDQWPTYSEFSRSGRSRLHYQVLLWGGPFYWAPRFDIKTNRRPLHWNLARIHGALSPVLKDRATWPTSREFKAAGLGALRGAVVRHGGIAHWAGVFGVELRIKGERMWTEEKIESALLALISALGHYPGPKEFFKNGEGNLYDVICRTGGHRGWEKRLVSSSPATG